MVAFVCNVKCLCGHVSKASTCCEHVGGFFSTVAIIVLKR